MSVGWSSCGAKGTTFAFALLVGCGGESSRAIGAHPEPSASGMDSGLGGATSTSTNPSVAGHTSSAAGSAVSGAGGRMASLAGGGLGSGQSAAGGSGGVNASDPGTSGAGGIGVGATGGSPSATGGTSAAEPPTPLEPPPPPTWDTIKLVLTGTIPPCIGAACHGGSGGKIHLGFPVKNDAQLYTVLTEYVSEPCANLPLVTPGHPEESALVMVLKGPCSEDVARMPNGCDDEQGNCVPDEYIAAVEQWIAQGAEHP